MADLLKIWRAGRVMRWHINPHLCETSEPDDGHAARVTLLALSINPNLSRDGIIHALTHDLGEHATGDMSYMVKVRNPAIASEIALMETVAINELGFDTPSISDEEEQLIKLCDWLDAWLWMAHHVPHLRYREDWIVQKRNAEKRADSLGVFRFISEAISNFELEHRSQASAYNDGKGVG